MAQYYNNSNRGYGGGYNQKQNSYLSTQTRSVADLQKFLSSESVMSQLSSCVAKNCNADDIVSSILTLAQKTPSLLNCKPESLLAAAVVCASMGTPPDGIHAYLVPQKANKDDSQSGIIPIPTARGLSEVAAAYGISSIVHGVVREGDLFEWRIEDGCLHYSHTPALYKTRPSDDTITHAYCTWRDKEGNLFGELMQIWEINEVKAMSRTSKEGTPWQKWFSEMARKTVVKRAAKHWPLPNQILEGMRKADEMEFGSFNDNKKDLRVVSRRKQTREEFEALPVVEDAPNFYPEEEEMISMSAEQAQEEPVTITRAANEAK